MASTEVIKRLQADGWRLHHVKGSHHQFKHPNHPGRVTVPHPKKDLPTGTLRNIFRAAGGRWTIPADRRSAAGWQWR
jgi:predicted RNA binding protein YcfA (HicA-like mRNA interferase family)